MKILVIVPSKGRPERAAQCLNSMYLAANGEVDGIVAVDHDDPKVKKYQDILNHDVYVNTPEFSGSFSKAINGCMPLVESRKYDIVGVVNDDHRFITPDWDTEVKNALTKTGIAYPNDLLMGSNLPTAVFMTVDIPLKLGWIAPPQLDHMYVDNVWKELGHGIDSLHYMPHVVIEHLHFTAGKSIMDETYRTTNTRKAMVEGEAAFKLWMLRNYRDSIGRIMDEIPTET